MGRRRASGDGRSRSRWRAPSATRSGPSRAVVYRLSGADLVDGGAPHEEVLTLAEALAGDGWRTR